MQLFQCQQQNESSQEQVSKLQTLLVEVSGEKAVLNEHFHTLAKNHEQMIRIKDEYKEENSRLLNRLQSKESGVLEQLQEELEQTRNGRDGLEKKCQLLENHVHELERKMETEKVAYQVKIEELTSNHSCELEGLQKDVESE